MRHNVHQNNLVFHILAAWNIPYQTGNIGRILNLPPLPFDTPLPGINFDIRMSDNFHPSHPKNYKSD